MVERPPDLPLTSVAGRQGHFCRDLGRIGTKSAENEVLLLEHDVPHSHFSDAVLACLPRLPWLITPQVSRAASPGPTRGQRTDTAPGPGWSGSGERQTRAALLGSTIQRRLHALRVLPAHCIQ